MNICLIGRHFPHSSPNFLTFDTLYDTVSKQISKQKNNIILLFFNVQGIPLFQAVAAS